MMPPQDPSGLLHFLPNTLPCHDPDVILQGFLDAMAERKVELYPAQEEAILHLLDNNSVILNTPTGSGKSLVALGYALLGFGSKEAFVLYLPCKSVSQ